MIPASNVFSAEDQDNTLSILDTVPLDRIHFMENDNSNNILLSEVCVFSPKKDKTVLREMAEDVNKWKYILWLFFEMTNISYIVNNNVLLT